MVLITAVEMLPLTQVLMMKGAAGMYENNRRERVVVTSPITTSTSNNTAVYPIYFLSVSIPSAAEHRSRPQTHLVQNRPTDKRLQRMRRGLDNSACHTISKLPIYHAKGPQTTPKQPLET